MEKQTYEPPCAHTIILLQKELVCASPVDVNAPFTNEGFGSDEEEFIW